MITEMASWLPPDARVFVCLLLSCLGVLLCMWYLCSAEQEPAENQFYTESGPTVFNLFLFKNKMKWNIYFQKEYGYFL